MSTWKYVIKDNQEYCIFKRDSQSNGFILVKKPLNQYSFGKIIEYFTADSDQSAIRYGFDLAKKNGLL